MTSNVERKENDSDNDMYDMLEIYEQPEYILWIMNEEKKENYGTYTHVTQNRDKNHSNKNNKKIK